MKCLNLIGQCEGSSNHLEPPSMESRSPPPRVDLHFATTMLSMNTLSEKLLIPEPKGKGC